MQNLEKGKVITLVIFILYVGYILFFTPLETFKDLYENKEIKGVIKSTYGTTAGTTFIIADRKYYGVFIKDYIYPVGMDSTIEFHDIVDKGDSLYRRAYSDTF